MTWPDALHRYADITQRRLLPPAPHAVTAGPTAMAMATMNRPTPRRVTPGEAMAAANQAATQNHAGQKQARPFHIRQPKYCRLRQSAKPLKHEPPSSLTFATSFFATHGTTAKARPKNCMSYSWRLESKFGSARRTLASAFQ